MIPSRAIRAFLGRPRDDLRRYKRMSDAALRRAAMALPARPPVWGKLQRDQRVLLIAAARVRRLAAWADTGVGKTLFSMALARYWRRAGIARRFLVLVPGNINLAEWESERDLHCPRTGMAVLSGSSRQKWAVVRGGAPLLTVATYAGLMRMACGKFVRRGKKWVPAEGARVRAGEEVRLRPVPRLVEELARTFDGLIMDESSADQAVQHRNLAWRICRKIAQPPERPVVALSGTPFGADPTPLWAQMYLVDRGESLGPTLGLFRAAFFKTEVNYFGGEKHTFRPEMADKLHRLLAHRSITIEADEASLPPVVARTLPISLPRDAEDYAIMARDQILAARGNYQETKNAFLRMRQISSGFLGYTDDETGKRAKFAFDECPKLELLLSRLQSIVGKYKVVVFHEFIYSGDRICAELARLGIGHARAGAGTKGKIKEERGRFVRDPECRVFIISNRMAQGPNLQVAKYVEFYETPIDPKTRKQARRRVERQHSEHSKVFITDYVVRGTYDQRILNHLEEGRNLFDAIIRGEVKS